MPDTQVTIEELPGSTPPAPATPVETQPADAQPPAVATPLITDDSVQLAQMAGELGITKDNIHQFVEGNKALQSITYLLNENPGEFFTTLQRSQPEVAARLQTSIVDGYLAAAKQKGYLDDIDESTGLPRSSGGNGRGTAVSAALDEKIADMDAQIAQLRQERQQEQQRAQYAQSKTAYLTQVDSLIKKLPESVPQRDKKAIKALLNESVGADPVAVSRLQRGIYLDLPRHLQSVLTDWSADLKAASDKEHSARAAVQAGAQPVITGGAANVAGSENFNERDEWDKAALEMASRMTAQK